MLDTESKRLGTLGEQKISLLLKVERIREETTHVFSPQLSLLNEKNQVLECFSGSENDVMILSNYAKTR